MAANRGAWDFWRCSIFGPDHSWQCDLRFPHRRHPNSAIHRWGSAAPDRRAVIRRSALSPCAAISANDAPASAANACCAVWNIWPAVVASLPCDDKSRSTTLSGPRVVVYKEPPLPHSVLERYRPAKLFRRPRRRAILDLPKSV